MKSVMIVVAALAVGGGAAYAQQQPNTALPPVAQTPNVAQPPSEPAKAADARPVAPDPAARRGHIQMLEGVLTTAVRNGAESLGKRLQIDPGSVVVTGVARARGIQLDGYGVFFDIDVPPMRASIVMSTLLIYRDQQKNDLRRAIAASPDPAERAQLTAMLRRLEGMQSSGAGPSPVAQPAPSNMVTAANVPDPDPGDPNEQYTESVKTALIDAMLEYSAPLGLADGEWLTIAARDSGGPSMPGVVEDASTIVLSVRGSDLKAFQTHQITVEEARKRVQVKEF